MEGVLAACMALVSRTNTASKVASSLSILAFIAASLFARFLSRQDESPTMKAVAALRNQFGGHAVKRVSESG